MDNDVAKQNEINKIVQYLQGGSNVESNVQLKKTESNKELMNGNQGQIPMQMGTTGVNNSAITKVNKKRPNENPPSVNQPIKKRKLASNTNPNSKPRKQPTTNTEIPGKTLTKKKAFKEQSTMETNVVEGPQTKDLMMKTKTIKTKKNISNSTENANSTATKVSIIF